ncbi:MAG: DNA-directed RNA polymerase subunit B [Candidatus Altiarchaeota archaeon]|nr:DNA-directed RNA polymerase subunit B [Candidatus Altiarchaeota archaeon]
MINVLVNGKIVGKLDKKQSEKLVANLRGLRRKGKIHSEITVAYIESRREVRIDTMAGRVLRPLIVVQSGKPLLKKEDLKKLEDGKIGWKDLLKTGKVEFLDGEEEENAFIALDEKSVTKQHTHLEPHPMTLLGVPGSLVPYANYSRGDRVNYGTSKGVKQALGIYSLNYPIRFDTFSNMLHYPQVPVVQTHMHKILNFDQHPAGQNFVVAMMTWEGYNMEDGMVFNQASLDRGLGRSTYFRPYSVIEKRYPGGQEDKIELPEKDLAGYTLEEHYALLDTDGIIHPESKADGDTVLVGRTSPPRFLGSMNLFRIGVESRRDTSERVRHDEHGWIDSVVVAENVEGRKLIRTRVRDDRIPELGDKFSSRHGQKGVIGMVVPHQDMPFTSTGIVPDMITNPHGIPSRMTFSQVIEFFTGKAAAVSGKIMNGTPFDGDPIKEARQILISHGLKPSGKETLYNGMTGEKYQVEIFTGVIYYHKVRHMVANKIHARARGPIQVLTRQPTEGRSKIGGLRMGEMEKDCLVSHGASLLLKERFSSDMTTIPVCSSCGVISIYDYMKDKAYCSVCGGENIEWIEVSYAFHIMLQELITIGIYPKLLLRDKR